MVITIFLECLCFFVYLVLAVWGALYMLPWILAVVIGIVMLMSSFGNASCLVMELLICSQRSVQLVP